MYKFNPAIKYRANGTVYETDELENIHYSMDFDVTDEAVKCVLHPKCEMEMLEFGVSAFKKMNKNEVFFSNGFQSWTTCYEFHANDKMSSVIPLADISKLTAHMAMISGDCKFAKYKGRGFFHSHTYTYFREGDEVELFGSMSERTGYTVFYLDDPNT